jgi:hypothetical protein
MALTISTSFPVQLFFVHFHRLHHLIHLHHHANQFTSIHSRVSSHHHQFHILLCFLVVNSIPTFPQATFLAAVRVGRVGVGPAVDGRPGRGQVLPPPALGQEAEDRGDDDEHEYEAGDRDADRKVALREADR